MIDYGKNAKRTFFKDGKDAFSRIEEKDGKINYIKLFQTAEEFFDCCKDIAKYSNIPHVPYTIEDVGIAMDLNISANFYLLRAIESANYLSHSINDVSVQKQIQESLSKSIEAVEVANYTWSSLSPLWMGQEVDGLNYYGANPYNYKPTLFEAPNATSKILNGEREFVDKYGQTRIFDDAFRDLMIRDKMFGKRDFSVDELVKATDWTYVDVNKQLEEKFIEQQKLLSK